MDPRPGQHGVRHAATVNPKDIRRDQNGPVVAQRQMGQTSSGPDGVWTIYASCVKMVGRSKRSCCATMANGFVLSFSRCSTSIEFMNRVRFLRPEMLRRNLTYCCRVTRSEASRKTQQSGAVVDYTHDVLVVGQREMGSFCHFWSSYGSCFSQPNIVFRSWSAVCLFRKASGMVV